MEDSHLGSNSEQKRNYILFTIAIFASFAIFGIGETIRGTAMPRIQAEFSLTELHLGLLLAVSSTGYLFACTITPKLAGKIGIRYSHVLGLILIALSGVTIFFAPDFTMVLAGFFLLNVGFGLSDIATSVLAAKIFTKNTGTMMNLAHFSFGAGAIFSPIISTSIMTARFADQVPSWRYVYLIVLAFALIPAIPVLLGRLKDSGNSNKKSGYKAMLKKPTIWLVAMVLFFGLAAESGLASWFVTYLENAHSFTSERAALFLTLYFITFTIARLVLGPFIDRLGFINSLVIVTAFAGTMIILGVIFGNDGPVLIILSGIGIAPIFPTVMAVIAKLFADTIELAMTTILTMIGALIVPTNFLIGGIINQARVLFTASHGEVGVSMAFSTGFLLFGAFAFIACLFVLILRRRQKRSGALI
ncbi:MAG: MFS transporter [Oscillospiraceae bacterium]|nr:MFS transporter [Oscillospiraceae bacterium]